MPKEFESYIKETANNLSNGKLFDMWCTVRKQRLAVLVKGEDATIIDRVFSIVNSIMLGRHCYAEIK